MCKSGVDCLGGHGQQALHVLAQLEEFGPTGLIWMSMFSVFEPFSRCLLLLFLLLSGTVSA
jgi:hypothetical protein